MLRLYSSCIVIACVTLSLSSCSSFLNSSKTSILISEQEGVSVTVTETMGTTLATEGSNRAKEGGYKLKNKTGFYMATQEKPGYLTNVSPILKTRPNNMVFFDIMFPLAIAGGIMLSIDEEDDEGSQELKGGAALLIAIYGVYYGANAPKYFFEEEYALPPIYEIPSFEDYRNFNFVSSSIHIDSAQFRVLSYPTMKSYINHSPSIKAMDYEIKTSSNDHVIKQVEEVLGFEKEKLSLIDVVPGLKMTVSQVDVTMLSAGMSWLFKIDLTTVWDWIDADTGKSMTDTINTESSWDAVSFWTYDQKDAERLTHKEYINAIAKAILEMGNSPNYNPLKTKAEYLEVLSEEWELLQIDVEELSEVPLKKSDAVESVVTLFSDKGHGSGCIISADGYIITNDHVVQGADGEELFATFSGGNELPVTVIRTNPFTDLALVKVDTTGLRPLQLCLESEIGQSVYAIGTPADRSFGQSMSRGIISAIRASGDVKMLQTDVSISPGISGGALIDENGKFIGVLRMKILGGGIEGLGFAIPVEDIESSLKLDFK